MDINEIMNDSEMSSEDKVAKINEWKNNAVNTEVDGLKNKNTEVIGTNKTLKEKLEAMEGKFGGVDVDKYNNLMGQMANDEVAKLFSEGKVDEAKNMIRQSVDGEYQEAINGHKTEIQQLQENLQKAVGREQSYKLSTELSAAISKVESFIPSALGDAQAAISNYFTFDDNGNLTHKEGLKDSDGNAVSVEHWLKSMSKDKPHWFSGKSGSGMTPGSAGSSGVYDAEYAKELIAAGKFEEYNKLMSEGKFGK